MSTIKGKHPKGTKKAIEFNLDTIEKIYFANAKKMANKVFIDAVAWGYIANRRSGLGKANHGNKLFGLSDLQEQQLLSDPPEPPSSEKMAEILRIMAPLARTIEIQAIANSIRVFSDLMAEPSIKNYFLQKSSVSQGKKGGRPNGKLPHTIWLEQEMQNNERNNESPTKLTAKQHYAELRNHGEIEGEDYDGNLEFNIKLADEFSRQGFDKVPKITFSAVTRALAKMGKP